MTFDHIFFMQVDSLKEAQVMREIRNECRDFMTRSTKLITEEEQEVWYNHLDHGSWKLYVMYASFHGVALAPIGYGYCHSIGSETLLTGGITEGYRGIGLGEKLFRFLIETARNHFDNKVTLEVLNSNSKAFSLYKKLGFIPVSDDGRVTKMEYKKMIPLFKVRMSDRASDSVATVLSSGFIAQGPRVDEFEELLQRELKSVTKPVTVNSGTSALDLALELCGVGPGDEVISTPQTCFATQIGAIHRHARIRWADIDQWTGLIDPDSVAKLITPKTKAILAVNWGGKLCDYKKLKSFGVPVIEDAAHTWDTFFTQDYERGDYVCYSLQAIKFLTSGDGGIVVCPTPEKEHEARLLRWFGLDRTKSESFRCTQNIKVAGFKYHMNDISAAIGISNIPEARKSVDQQRKNAKYLIDNIKNDAVITPDWDDTTSYWLFSMHVLDGRKKEFEQYLMYKGIASSPVHYRNDLYDSTLPYKEGDLPGVTAFDKTQICIPVGWWLHEEDLRYIVESVNAF